MNTKSNPFPVSGAEMLACYERAKTVMRGLGSTRVVRNSTVYPTWIGRSNVFWYLREFLLDGDLDKPGKEFRLVDAEAASNERAFDHSLLAALLSDATGESVDPHNLPLGTVEIELAPRVVEFTAVGQSWRYDEESGTLEASNRYPNEWEICPDGKQAVFARDHNLWLRDLQSGAERALTTDGEAFYNYGSSSTMWGSGARPVPPGLPVQVRWSPDGKTLFTLQKDRRKVKVFPIVHHVPADGSVRPQLIESRVAYEGDEHIEEYRLLLIDVETGRQRPVDYPRVPVVQESNTGFFSRQHGWWHQDSRCAYFIDIDRYFRRARVVEVNTQSGATRVVLEETAETNLLLANHEAWAPNCLYLPATEELIWYSERSGWAHFYLYDLKTGALKNTLTAGEWRVHNLVRFDPTRRALFITTAERIADRNPYYRDLVRVDIDTGEMVIVIDGDYEHEIANRSDFSAIYARFICADADACNGVSASGDYAVATRSRVDTVPETVLLDRNGEQIMVVETADLTLPEGWEWPEPVKMAAADGETDIYGVIYKPANFDPSRSYPVIDSTYVYNPCTSLVAKGSFTQSGVGGVNYYYEAALAQLGFIVVQMDGRGCSNRSKAFLDASYGSFEDGNKLEDHVAGIKQLIERYSYMDADRVGIVSTGRGSGPVMGLMKYPEFYRVGAGTHIFDGRLQLSIRSADRYIGPEGSAPGTLMLEDRAPDFKGKLLQCVGLLGATDSTITATLRVLDALQRANKDVDVVVEPRVMSGVSSYQLRRIWDYLVRHLQGNIPPDGFELCGTTIDVGDLP